MKDTPRLLVLTGHSEFWPKIKEEEEHALYLGPWCFSRNQFRKFFEQDDFEMAPSPYKDWKDVELHWTYISKLHDRLIVSLSKYLNDLCDLQESEKFWKLRSSYWLVHWLCSYYDRYLTIKNLNAEYPLVATVVNYSGGLKIKSCEDALERLKEHEYNLILYSELLNFLKFPSIVLKRESIELFRVFQKQTLKSKIHFFLNYQFFLVFFGLFFGECKGLSFFDKIRLSLKSFSIQRFWSVIFRKIKIRKKEFNSINTHKEINFSDYFVSNNEFENCISENIIKHIPESVFTKEPSSAEEGIWIGFDIYNSKKADLISRYTSGKNGKWYSVQHGGGYDQYLVFPHEKMEYEVSDGFVSWGWASKNSSKLTFLPSPHLVNLRKMNVDSRQKKQILYISTEHFAYFLRLHSTLRPELQFSYLREQANFIANLSEEVSKDFVFRASIQFGWNNLEYLKREDRLPKTISSINEDIFSRILKARLVVVDHLATSYMESFALNIPTILYFKEEMFGYSAKFKPYLMSLKEVGIYHEDSFSAVRFLNENYHKIEDWWASEKVQNRIQDFLSEYGRVNENWFVAWKSFSDQLLHPTF
ncbi:LIC12162 family transferase [Leptospira borgpetersenii]|uniref:LIC12162 family transferase n=2 Tax=Leptospira borgpetersenii TaxID=174 RepID=UPI001880BFCD|nr:LIC12162 family protein [Leptospira borgpetersenii]MBE8363210.1 transferase [Leptospira borgpetersenii serovar Balcanica]MBE8422232.1 transferase [Leptospira borgpetersenii serovar Balcanica]MBF3349385.1 transferase [Leptospira borgpetersenii serovar Balcanica]MBF3376618.1 transferase [Leptospira borgpetersenii serovar Balcanica]